MKEIDESPESIAAYLASDLLSVRNCKSNWSIDASNLECITLRIDNGKSICAETSATCYIKFTRNNTIKICLYLNYGEHGRYD